MPADTPSPCDARRARGFTLIELLVVLGIVALLLTLAVPRYFPSLDKAKETVLADNLRNLRTTIDQFHGDTGRYPDTLEQLVDKKYLRAMPIDPITESDASWIIVPPPDDTPGQVYDVKSGAPGKDRSGTPFADW
ncbi:type II secretion system protein [Janthinobacterium sp. 1_2014MBL_MicDiv]|uniref:type II secretion system protein n=1 Tax=Janthinobacterium sp. 1_2014MBL_MicDiv TaxID=1644131 RepID=UPI0008F479B9|nr:prepilin-type N-terminal cleavage/methylation domain-containing protein [Janthinobacterium sp. 1_2014MBL_MicDiv]APA69627.1 type II secretion system protein G [Janthinobacterium sp. 1_2014MBL_MicDiv]